MALAKSRQAMHSSQQLSSKHYGRALQSWLSHLKLYFYGESLSISAEFWVSKLELALEIHILGR